LREPVPVLEEVFRAHHGLVLSALVRAFNDFDLAEEALSDAVSSALENWPSAGTPDNPAAWLVTVGKRKGIDRIRRRKALESKLPLLMEIPPETGPFEEPEVPDERLLLLFACCHPALSLEAKVPLTLRSLGGLSTAEIARAFVTSEAAMFQRITRAKNKIRLAGIPIVMPDADDLESRLDGVLAVIYLIFNEGYSALEGEELVRVDLCHEAIRLAEMLTGLLPANAEVWGLSALCWLTEARRPSRLDSEGEMVLLEDQDRQRWDRFAMRRGLDRLMVGRMAEGGGPYMIQAEIAAVHASAATASETDWAAVVGHYQRLLEAKPSPVVGLNLAAAVAMSEGPEKGLVLLEELASPLANYQPFHASRAELLLRAGRGADAVASFLRALDFPLNEVQRRHLTRRLSEAYSATLSYPAPEADG
jgi:RNA polymerase sigma-70 factor, ECF subfamily